MSLLAFSRFSCDMLRSTVAGGRTYEVLHFFTEMPPALVVVVTRDKDNDVDDDVEDVDKGDIEEEMAVDSDKVRWGLSTYSLGLARCRWGESILTISRGGGRGGTTGIVVVAVVVAIVDAAREEEGKGD